MVLKSVSRKLRSCASRWTTLCSPSVSSRPMRPSTLSRKLDLVAAIGENQLNEWQNGTIAGFVNHNSAQPWHNHPIPANAAPQAARDGLNPRYGAVGAAVHAASWRWLSKSF